MGTVQAFTVDGVRMWFWSNDHDPPHFHIKRRGEWEARVFFLDNRAEMIEFVWRRKAPSRKSINQLYALVEQHRTELLMQWEKTHGSQR